MKEENETSHYLPLVALIGPTNAGKSSLFNRFSGSFQAVTAKEEATTRDRVYGLGSWQGRFFNMVDTAGLIETGASDIHNLSRAQMDLAIDEADLILFVYDGRVGLAEADKIHLNNVRKKNKKIYLIANKVDTYEVEKKIRLQDDLGLPFFAISARTSRRVGDLLDKLTSEINAPRQVTDLKKPLIALIGRPNTGKSTLLNALTRSNRAIVSTIPGTTRDVVTGSLEIDNKQLLLADTAGVRRKGKITLGPEKFSLKRTVDAIAEASAVILLLDSSEGSTRGDLHLLDFAKSLKKPILLLFNKSDLLDDSSEIKLHPFLNKYDSLLISALKEEGLDEVVTWIKKTVF